jgi:hypothetical protein
MEDLVYGVLFFGGATAVLLAFSPIGRALADRIRPRGGQPEPDPAVQEELARLRADMAELQERMDFTERVLAQRKEPARLPAEQ